MKKQSSCSVRWYPCFYQDASIQQSNHHTTHKDYREYDVVNCCKLKRWKTKRLWGTKVHTTKIRAPPEEAITQLTFAIRNKHWRQDIIATTTCLIISERATWNETSSAASPGNPVYIPATDSYRYSSALQRHIRHYRIHQPRKRLRRNRIVWKMDHDSRIGVKQTTHLVNLRTMRPHLPVQLRQFDVNNFVSKAFNSRSMADFNSTRYLEIQRQKSLQHVPLYFI